MASRWIVLISSHLGLGLFSLKSIKRYNEEIVITMAVMTKDLLIRLLTMQESWVVPHIYRYSKEGN
jgi:hypothetical protein